MTLRRYALFVQEAIAQELARFLEVVNDHQASKR
jgi:hypothetical protein